MYGKGLKGIELNTSLTEMDKISPYVLKEFQVSSDVGSYNKIYPTYAGLFVIDKNNDLWSYGNNFGLTDDQRIEYTSREWVKLDLGKNNLGEDYKAQKVFGTDSAVFVVTVTNELLATGQNTYGQLGTGDYLEKTTFVLSNGIPNPSSIVDITGSNYSNEGGSSIVETIDDSNNKHFYLCGTDVYNGLGFGISHSFRSTNFVEIFKGESGKGNNIANTIKHIYSNHHERTFIWFENGDFYFTGWNAKFNNGKWNVPKVVDVRCSVSMVVLKCENTDADNNTIIEYYGATTSPCYGLGGNYQVKTPIKINIPSGVTIKDFNIINNSACYFLTTTNDVYGMGNYSNFCDKNNIVSYTKGDMELIPNLSKKIDCFYGSDFEIANMHGQLFFCGNGKYYLTNNTNIMYGNDILQKSWTKIASNVLNYYPECCAYITRDFNVYIAGSDSRFLGLGEVSKTQTIINNYTLIQQEEIAGHAKELYKGNGAIYILTTENKLYGAGVDNERRGETYNYCGWETLDENENVIFSNAPYYKLVMENVKLMLLGENGYNSKAVLTTDGKVYYWGFYLQFVGLDTEKKYLKTEFAFPTALVKADNIKKWVTGGTFRSFVVGNDGKFYIGGNWTNIFNGGFTKNGYGFEEFTYGFNLQPGEKIVDVSVAGSNTCITLTNQGRLYGYGTAKLLGIDRTDNALIDNQMLNKGEINGKKITQIVAGNNWYIAVDENGRVYGTGTNVYGVLGRWKGTGRDMPNSRYRSSFIWVECPELEF